MSQLTEPVLSLIVQIITKICANHNNIDQEINRILETTNGAKYNLTIHERLTLRYIGEQKITNATTIASNTGITRGGISKICGRLIKKELITANRMEGNRKEIFYRLTSSGDHIYQSMAQQIRDAEGQCRELIESYSAEELVLLANFLRKIEEIIP